MVYTIAVTSQGQISIPVDVQRKLGFNKSGKASLKVEGNRIIVEPVSDFMSLKGSLHSNKKPLSSREIHERFSRYLSGKIRKSSE